jgi:predicted transcriptional regulator
MAYTYRIWDRISAINGCPAQKAIESLRIKEDQQLCILSDENGRDCITQTFSITDSIDKIKTWVDNFNSEAEAAKAAAEEEAKKPTTEQLISSMQAQIDALTLAQLGVTE